MYPSSFAITSQIGVETTPGTVVAANRLVQALSLMLRLKRTTGQTRSRAHKYQDSSVGKRVWGEGTYEGVLCYNAIVYVLSSLFAAPAAVQIGATAAYTRTYLASDLSDVTRKTYSTQVGSSDGVDRFPYTQLASMQCNLSQDEAKVSGDLFAQQPAFNQTQTASPTKILARPVSRRHIDVYLDTSYGSIGTTKVADALQETLSIGTKWKPVWEHNNGGSKTFRRAAEQASIVNFGFLTPHNSQSRAYCDSLLDEAMRYLRIMCTGAQIATDGVTPVYERIIFDLAGKFEVAEEDETDDVYARRFSFNSLYDGNLGGAFRAQVTNLLSSL